MIGIDPGLTGAAAVLEPDGQLRTYLDLPVIRDHALAWIDGDRLLSTLLEAKGSDTARVIIERAASRPRQGVRSAFSFGLAFGSILATVQALRLPIELVTPAQWKRVLGLPADKRAALDRARLLFPSADLSHARHHGRAEALLIDYWCLRHGPAQRAAARPTDRANNEE